MSCVLHYWCANHSNFRLQTYNIFWIHLIWSYDNKCKYSGTLYQINLYFLKSRVSGIIDWVNGLWKFCLPSDLDLTLFFI